MNKLLIFTILSIFALSTIAQDDLPIDDLPTDPITDLPTEEPTEEPTDKPTGLPAGVPSQFAKDCLDNHNPAREAVNIEGLKYSLELEKTAKAWAKTIAGKNSLQHSKNRNKIGENLAMGSKGVYDTKKLIGLWLNEKKNYRHKPFGNGCSTTGSWQAVAHYTQIVWENTKEVGCAIAENNKNSFMVCHYKPTGNWNGDYAY
jgi:hypothetical protein